MPSTLEALAESHSPIMCRLAVLANGVEVGTGSAFLTIHGLVTNSHTSRPPEGTTFLVRNRDGDEWSMPAREVYERKIAESLKHEHDYAVLSLKDAPAGFAPSALEVQPPPMPPVGRQVAYLGYPFGARQLVVSSGYVSSVDTAGAVTVLRIDGSVNKGNSGGPLFDVETGLLIGIISRAETGLVRDQFEELRKALANNVAVLSNTQAVIQVGGIDPIQGIRATMVAMSMIADQLERSANVGIGFAFWTDRLAAALTS